LMPGQVVVSVPQACFGDVADEVPTTLKVKQG